MRKRFRKDLSNEKTRHKMELAGRGEGEGVDYQSWLAVQDFASKGFVSRLRGWKTGTRPVQLMSNIELYYFYTLEWNRSVKEYREQFKLDLEATQQLAKEFGIKHPASVETKMDVPMTSDFWLRVQDGEREIICVRSVKPSEEELTDRDREKMKIERAYWERRQANWALITRKDIDLCLARNVASVHDYFDLEYYAPLTQQDAEQVHQILWPKVEQGQHSLADLACAVDEKLGLNAGSSLVIAKHLIARRRWPVDFTKPFSPSRTLLITRN